MELLEGEPEEAQKTLSILAKLNEAEAAKIRAGPPARRRLKCPRVILA